MVVKQNQVSFEVNIAPAWMLTKTYMEAHFLLHFKGFLCLI
jgi:hypothetical protein